MVLDKIKAPNDIKKLDKSELPVLAEEIREFLIQKISEIGRASCRERVSA